MGSNNTRSTPTEFEQKAIRVHGIKYDYSRVEYRNAHTKVSLVCPVHGVFMQKPNSHLAGSGCKECGKITAGKGKRDSKADFVLKAKAVHGDKYDYSVSNYSTSKVVVTISCPTHGVFYQKPNAHVRGQGCQECAKSASAAASRQSKEQFVSKAKTVHGDKYDYSSVVYRNAMEKVAIICKYHGEFLQSPSQHLSYGCKKCGDLKVSTRLRDTKEAFVEKAIALHGVKYDYASVAYQSSVVKVNITCPEHGNFYQQPYSHLNGRGCPTCSNIGPSVDEMALSKYISSLVPVVLSDRNLIAPFEIDCLVPEKRLGVEFCGVYYHSDKFRADSYHLDKMNAVNLAGYGLLQVFDDEWRDKQAIVKGIIKNRLGLSSSRFFARNTTVKEVGLHDSKHFLGANHIQGYARASVHLGLYNGGELLMLATFSDTRSILGHLEKGWFELVRLCALTDTVVVGGFSKLLKAFTKGYSPVGIKTFCDLRYFTGAGYEAVGFMKSHDSKPNYYYIKSGKRYSRYMFQKHKLAQKLPNFDRSLSEKENMSRNGYSRIHDCGNRVYIMPLQI